MLDQTAQLLSEIEVTDPHFKNIDPSTDNGKVEVGILASAKATTTLEQNTHPKAKNQLTRVSNMVVSAISDVLANTGGKRAVLGLSGLALATAACSTQVGPNAPEMGLPGSATATEVVPGGTETVPIEITPAAAPTRVSQEEIRNNINKPLPPNVVGNTERSSVPMGSTAFTESENLDLVKSLRAKGLIHVVSGGVLSYLGEDGKAYMPVIDQITNPATGKVLRPIGPADKDGVVTYRSEDSQVTQYSVVSVACQEDIACMQVVSFNPEDPGITYDIKVDLKTGKIIGFVPAISATKPSNVSFGAPNSSKWGTPLTGQAALGQVDNLMGIECTPGNGTQDGTFSFVSGTEVVTSTDKEISWQSDFGLIVKKESGRIFVWDGDKQQWNKAVTANIEGVKDNARIFEVGDRSFIEVNGKEMFVANVSPDSNGSTIATTTEGTALLWREGSWELLLPDGPLTLENIKEGRWGAYTFIQNSEGYYELEDSRGNLIPDIKFFEDGTSELTYQGKDSTIAYQVITQKEEELIVGLWDYKEGAWSMETYKAPKSEEETKNWRSLAVIQGHEKEQAMIDTIPDATDVAISESETYDPKSEFEGITVTYNFKTVENFDVTPARWKYLSTDLGTKGSFAFIATSRYPEVDYGGGYP